MVADRFMSMIITNPHEAFTVLSVRVRWNAATGAPASKPLALVGARLGDTFWVGSNNSGDFTIVPATTVTLPGNNQSSSITFTFDSPYKSPLIVSEIPRIVITLSTPGCVTGESVTIQVP